MFNIQGFLKGTKFCFSWKVFFVWLYQLYLTLLLFLLLLYFYEKYHRVIICFPGGSPSTVSLWFAINLVYKMLPHWRWWELLDIQSTDVGLHQEFGTSVWSKQMGAPAELRACGRAWSGFGPANCSKITGTLASELKFFFVLCPVFSLLCHSLSSGLWICPLSH